MKLKIDSFSVDVQRKSILHMYLRVKAPDGGIFVTAPMHAEEKRIVDFIQSRADWIRQQQAKIAGAQVEQKNRLWLFGQVYPVRTFRGVKRNRVELRSGEVWVILRTDADEEARERTVKEWYRACLLARLKVLLPRWERVTGLSPREWRIKDMKTRWGTCNTGAGRIWFSLGLAKQEEACIEYVILHELAHLRVPNHGKDFAELLDRYMPDWRSVKKRLNRRG